MNNLTWTCHICKEERPDDKISVFKRDLNLRGIIITENVRYCNDRPACIDGAKLYSHMGSND